MSTEILKCPLCGNDPIAVRWSLAQQQKLDPVRDSFSALICCGHMARKAEWNKYAAAMELAKAAYESSDKDALRPYVARIMEVFK